jgi:hypothetical protein
MKFRFILYVISLQILLTTSLKAHLSEICINVSGLSGQTFTIEMVADGPIWVRGAGASQYVITTDPAYTHAIHYGDSNFTCKQYWFDYDAGSSSPVVSIGRANYIVLFKINGNTIKHYTVNTLFCALSEEESNDVYLHYDVNVEQLFLCSMSSCDYNKHIGTISEYSAIQIPYAGSDRSCFALNVVLRNDFVKSDQSIVHGGNLITACDDTLYSPIVHVSGDTAVLTLDQFFYDIYPSSNIVDSIEQPYIHRFHNWLNLNDVSDIKYGFATNQENGLLLNTLFFKSLSGQIFIWCEGLAQADSVHLRDPWKVHYDGFYVETLTQFTNYFVPANGLNLGDYTGFGGVHKNQSATASSLPYYSLQSANSKT